MIIVWRCNNGSIIHKLKGHRLSILCLAISFDNNYIVSGSLDGEVRIWDKENGLLD